MVIVCYECIVFQNREYAFPCSTLFLLPYKSGWLTDVSIYGARPFSPLHCYMFNVCHVFHIFQGVVYTVSGSTFLLLPWELACLCLTYDCCLLWCLSFSSSSLFWQFSLCCITIASWFTICAILRLRDGCLDTFSKQNGMKIDSSVVCGSIFP